MIELTDTNSAGIAAELVRARMRAGSPAMGMVMTLLIVVDEAGSHDAMTAARQASHEHPARVLAVILGDGRGAAHVHAQVGTGEAGWSGEVALIRLRGEVVKHAASVVGPLLLPDSPVAVWWPTDHPTDPAADPIGALATRRITDTAAASVRSRTRALRQLCETYAPGNTDLAWTRVTPWRALLAAALDQNPLRVTSAAVTSERLSPSARLLSAWISTRLRVPVSEHVSRGPGITEVVLSTKAGDIVISRSDGRLAQFSAPGQPDRPVALKRREVPELLGEELRHLDEDGVYAETVRHLARSEQRSGGVSPPSTPPATGSGGSATKTTKKTTAKKATKKATEKATKKATKKGAGR